MTTTSSRQTRGGTGPGPRTTVIPMPAEIDLTNGAQVQDALVRAICSATAVLVADASMTTFCDCAGLSALTRAHHQAAKAGVEFRIAAGPAVRRLLQLTRTDRIVSTYPTLAGALVSEQTCRARQSARLPPAVD